MKTFLIRICMFCALIAATLAIGEILIRKYPNPYATKDAYITAHGKDIHTLILGNSHSFYGIRTDLMPDTAVNLGNVSQTLAYDRILLEHYLPMMPNLKRVIMQASYTSLFDDEIENSDEWWRAINYQLYMHTAMHGSMTRYAYEFSHIPVYAAKLGNILGLNAPSLTCDSLGNGLGYTFDNRAADWETSGTVIADRHAGCFVGSRLPVNLSHIEAIADSCISHGIQLIVFTQPGWHTYRENIDLDRMRQVEKILTDLSHKKGFTYLNYFDDTRFVDEDFYDTDHLTHEYGAVKLTNILLEQIDGK